MTTISCGVISKLYQEPYCNVYSLMMLPRNKTRSNASQPNPLDRHLKKIGRFPFLSFRPMNVTSLHRQLNSQWSEEAPDGRPGKANKARRPWRHSARFSGLQVLRTRGQNTLRSYSPCGNRCAHRSVGVKPA